MLLLQQLYPFLQAIGFAIANNLWQAAFIYILYEAISGTFKLNSSLKYVFAVIAQTIVFVAFLISINHFYTFSSFAYKNNIPFQNSFSIAFSSETINTILNSVTKNGSVFLPYLAAIYLLSLTILIIKWIFRYRITQQYYHQTSPLFSSPWNDFIEDISYQLNIKKKIQLFVSEKISGPITIGFLKPIILIPLATINHLSKEQMEAVLLHEIAHIKRHDYFINLFMTMFETILFFNPFIYFIRKKIQKEREHCCDDWVLAYHYAPAEYAEALLQLAYLSNTKRSALLSMHAVKNDGLLLSRVKRLLGLKEVNHTKKSSVFSLLVLLLLMALPLLIGFNVSTHPNTPLAFKRVEIDHQLLITQKTSNPKTHLITKKKSIASIKENISIQQNEVVEKNDLIVDETVQALKELNTLQVQKDNINNNNFTKTASGLSYSDADIKQKLKNYTQLKGISIQDLKSKVDSINIVERKIVKNGLQLLTGTGQNKTSLFVPAVYYYMNNNLKTLDSLHQKALMLSDGKEQKKEHLFIVINQQNEKGEPIQLIIEIADKTE